MFKTNNTVILTDTDLNRQERDCHINTIDIYSFRPDMMDLFIRSDIVIYCDNRVGLNRILKNRFGSSSLSDTDMMEELNEITKLKMFWFSRWLATNYNNVLNSVDGRWYVKQIKWFNEKVFPAMLAEEIYQNSFETTIKFIEDEYI